MDLLQDVLAEVKQAVRRLYGPRLKQVILYGSWARGDATNPSTSTSTSFGVVSPLLLHVRREGVPA